jgi:fluoroquinolone resistance protein
MEGLIHDEKTFSKITYTGKTIKGREFQSCTFEQCDFSDSDFSYNKFLDCTFINCNLSMMKLLKTTLSSGRFKGCKILGVNFHECENFLFSVDFDDCVLDYSSFINKKMPKTKFSKCSLKEAVFTGAILAGSAFADSNLFETRFNQTDLSAANFVTAHNFDIDPQLNIITKAKFSMHGLPGLLGRYNIIIHD